MGADFSGYATKAGLKCSDNRVITSDAFKHQDKMRVPLLWSHQHQTPESVLGYAELTHRQDGMYCEAFFNGTPSGKIAREMVRHGDVNQLSIYANRLTEKDINGLRQVIHGNIREVSIVLAGANPGAKIDYIDIRHGDGEFEHLDDEAVITTGLHFEHVDSDDEDFDDDDEDLDHADGDERTVQDVYDAMTDEEKQVVHFMIGAAIDAAAAEHSDTSDAAHQAGDDNEGDLSHQEGTQHMNVFDQNGSGGGSGTQTGGTLTHDQLMEVVAEARKTGSLKGALQHAAEQYGITNIEVLFPDAKQVDGTPQWITRQMEWVPTVLSGVKKIPQARWKSRSADITHEEARAKGYIKGNMKKEQYFEIAGRENGPTTIYKKQKLDRDDIIDITDFDVVNWIWGEMRIMLNEEIARAILIGDGREIDDDDKINETKIRPIAHDDDFYAYKLVVANNREWVDIIEDVMRARKNYKGVGNPTFYTTEDTLNAMLLIRDESGSNRRLYNSISELATALRAKDIIPVEVMEGVNTSDGELLGIFVNLADYYVGTDRGGEVTTFDDFDIDYNQYKYLIEGRMSGALAHHKTAIVLVRDATGTVTPGVPTFVSGTGVVTIPNTANVVYKNKTTGATLSAGAQSAIAAGSTIEIVAVPATGYVFPHNFDADWSFTRPAS